MIGLDESPIAWIDAFFALFLALDTGIRLLPVNPPRLALSYCSSWVLLGFFQARTTLLATSG